jgi:RNase_H superfamily
VKARDARLKAWGYNKKSRTSPQQLSRHKENQALVDQPQRAEPRRLERYVPPKSLTPMLPTAVLPRAICALDIETAKTNLRKPEECEIACVGVLTYKRAGFSWRRGDYLWFDHEHLASLWAFLKNFEGVIVGHNIFDFDYRVLHRYIQLDGVVEKSVDLRMLLMGVDYRRRARLSLESLTKINLSRRKIYNGRQLPELWRQGQRRKVLAHNKRDCELTAELWQYLVRRRMFCTKVLIGRESEFHYEIDSKSLQVLVGKVPQLDHATWRIRLQEWGNALRPPNFNSKTYIQEPKAGRRPLFHKVICPECERAFILVARRSRWFAPGETIDCPFCARGIPLDPDENVSTLVLGEGPMQSSLRPGSCYFVQFSRKPLRSEEQWPTIEVARTWIDGLRIWKW